MKEVKRMNRQMAIWLTAAALLAGGCEKKAPAQKETPRYPVRTIHPEKGTRHSTYRALGVIRPVRQVELVARVSGTLLERNFLGGEPVRQGQLLYRIDPAPFEIALRQAEAALDRAKARSDNAALEFGRIQKLYSEDISAATRFDQARAAKLESDAAVLAAEAELARARLNDSYTRIAAPFDGWIGPSRYDPGNYLHAPTPPLAELSDVSKVKVDFNVSDRYLVPRYAPGLMRGEPPRCRVTLRLPDGSKYPASGKITEWSNGFNPSTAALRLTAEFENPDRRLLPGMTVEVRMEAEQGEEVLLLPENALRQSQTLSFIYLAGKDNRVEMREVVPGETDEQGRATVSGLAAEDRVILPGNPLIRPGMEVTVLPEAAK